MAFATRANSGIFLRAMSERRTILALGWVSFFMDISSEMIYPLLPVFLSSLGVGAVAIGFLAGISESAASFVRVFSGFISDRVKKRKTAILLGYGLSTVSRPILAIASGWGHVLAYRLIDRAGKGVRNPPRDALIAEVSSVERYGRSYGIQRAMDTAGAVIGPGLAAGILALGFRDRSVFWISLIPAVIAVAIVQLFVRERRRPRPGFTGAPAEPGSRGAPREAGGAAGPRDRGQTGGGAMTGSAGVGGGATDGKNAPGSSLFSRDLTIFLVVTAVFSLGNSSNFFLVLRAKNLGFEDRLIPILYMTMNVMYATLSYPAGRLADRFGKGTVAFVGYLLYAALYALFAIEANMNALWVLFPLQGIYLAITDGVGTAYMATLLPGARKATGFAIYHTIIGLALLPAGTMGGWLWEHLSPAATFIAGSLLSLIAAAIFGSQLLRRKGAGARSERLR
jgi:MFS family permease